MADKKRKKKPAEIAKNSGPKADVQKKGQNEELDLLGQLAQAFILKLSEHCDTCQFVCTKLEINGLTSLVHVGSGNVYARAKSMESVIGRWSDAGVI